MSNVQLLSVTEARKEFKDVLDAVESGRPVGVERRSRRTALVDVGGLLAVISHSRDLPQPVAVAEAGGWSMFIPGAPVAVDGSTLEEATDELILALREYAEDWVDRLNAVPNHALHWALIQFVAYSSDEQLASWIRDADE